MRINYKNLTSLNILNFIFLTFVCSNLVIAQSNSIQHFTEESRAIQDTINTLKIHLDDLQNRFIKLNKEIYQLKTVLRTGENPIKRIKLESELKESSKYADQIKQINIRIEELNNKLKGNYKEIIKEINHQINMEIKKFNSTNISSLKTIIIKKVNSYEEEKQRYYKILNEEIPSVVEDSSIVINSNDNLERLDLKIDLIKDRLTFLEEEKKYLLKKKEELTSDFLIYKEMSDFMNDLRRNIDEEQEFYDPDRTEQINLRMKEIKNRITSDEKRLNDITKSKLYYQQKLKIFNDYKNSLLFH